MKQQIQNLLVKFRNLIQRAKVTNVPDVESRDYPIVQVQSLGKTMDTEVISPYGLSSNVTKDSLGIVFAIRGDMANRTMMGYDPATRVKGLRPGEVAIGNPTIGTYFKFNELGQIEVWKENVLVIQDLTAHRHAVLTAPGTTGPPNS